VLVMLGLSMLIFVLVRAIPGDPARMALGPESSPEQVQNLRRELALDRPLPVQYYLFIKGIFDGKMGMSLVTMRDVSKDLVQRYPATVELVFTALFLAIILGVPFGVISALHKDRFIDHVSRLFAFTGLSLPRYWIGLMLQLLISFQLGWLPFIGRITGVPPDHITGLYLVDSLLTGNLTAFGDSLRHILLPAITLALSPMAQIVRLCRANMIEQLRKDYSIVARINGMPENLNIYKYMLKNALTSVLTITGLIAGWMIGNAFLVEAVFAWPGVAFYGINSVIRKDFNAVVGVTLLVGLGYSIINFIVDLLYGYLDPRIRLNKE
jgi:peptide/nickel transport system permease protein